ncbi:High-affinity glucose transporter 6 [Colletotrichum chlorophyti]|uniref:High-affinity glucose transporter 6 n=1 Tax=Colletotrichum chlorophyti TaxID=708187 RepID=A0A1Q8RPC1_9PEZI|nr:High-affinity glucose transporter 6 [Colletotrichum chlorophyti]
MHGAIVSSILITGALSALVAGVLADQHGRVAIISCGAATYGLGAAIECGAVHLAMFIVGRAIKGIGMGLFVSSVTVQISEISPAAERGLWVNSSQLLLTVGLVMGYFICYGTGRIAGSSASWRVPIAIQSLLGFGFAAATLFVPPSPRWLISKGNVDEARIVILQLGISPEEQQEMLAQQAEVSIHPPGTTFRENLKDLLKGFRKALSTPYRSRTAFGCFLMTFQQFSGIDGVLYYAPLLFRQAGLASEQASFLASGVTAIVLMVVTIPGTIFADSWGRRTSTLVGGAGIAFLMFLMGGLYAADRVHPDTGAGRWVVIVSIYLFAFIFNGTWAIGFRASLVESLPRETRSSGAALAQCGNWAANYLVALTTPPFLEATASGPYFFFGGCCVVCSVCSWLWMPETRSKSLEAIEAEYFESRKASDKRQGPQMRELLERSGS